MKEILVNQKIKGIFSISFLAVTWLAEHNHPIALEELKLLNFYNKAFLCSTGHTKSFDGYKRDDPLLIECVKILKEKANSLDSKLKIISIPDDVDWIISANNNFEWVAEKHRT